MNIRVFLVLVALVISPHDAFATSGQFVGDVVAKWLPGGREMQLTDDFGYVDASGRRWMVPKGSVVDGASIPRSLWSIVGAPFNGNYRKASVVHDFFCQRMTHPWKDVHRLFFEASLAEGNSLYHAKLMYGAVYAWGPRWEMVDGKPVRTREAVVPPSESEVERLAEWIKANDPTLDDISRFVENRFPRGPPAQNARMALVIGNSNYSHTRTLPNARHDAFAMADFLAGLGYRITARHDAGYDALRSVVREFSGAAADAEFAVVYFAGHGMEIAGQNYLLPTDAKLATSADLEYEAVTLASLLDAVRARRKLNLVIVDACRNNPLADKMTLREGATRSVRRGLARVEAKGDLLVAFAANAGTVAQDGTGHNSPFVEALIDHLGKPGLDIRLALGGVRDAVLTATGNAQEPVIYGALGGQVVSLVAPAEGAAQPSLASREQEARTAWESVKDSCNAPDIRLFAGRYRNTFFGDLAAKRVGEIEQKTICVPWAEVALDEQLTREVQAELKRLGCFGGPVNGTWGPQTVAAFKSYVRLAKLSEDTQAPNEEILAGMKRASGRICLPAVKTAAPPPAAAPAPGKALPVPKVVSGDCASVRSACVQIRTQCMRVCREKMEDRTYGSCHGCVTSFSTCMKQGSSGACQ